LRAIAFDSKTFIEISGLEWSEFKDIAKKTINRILDSAKSF